MNANLNAFLILIRTGEGTLGENGYRTLYGGGLFDSFADHPRIKVNAGKWTSTAAGAYQILAKTWDGLVAMQPDVFTDFTPDKQDAAAVYLIKGHRAYDDVIAGRFKDAVLKCNKEWASLPGSPYGQPTLTMQKAMLILINAGGVPAAEQPTQQETPMIPLAASILVNALPSLIGALPEIANIFKKPDVAERNVEAVAKVGSILMQSTGATNMQEAVERVQADPQTATEANDALRLNRADLMDVIERGEKLSETSVGAARDYGLREKPVAGNWQFNQILALVIVVVASVLSGFVMSNTPTASNMGERTMVLNTWLVIGLAGVIYFWYGSSRGSQIKDEMKDRK
jgi:muramidase (phage lysozyme)